MIFIIVFAILALILLIWQASLVVAVIGGSPTIYSKAKTIKKAFAAVGLKRGQTVVDLGCGNAKSLIIAAKNFGAKGIGLEISPYYCLVAKINVWRSGESKNIKIVFGNLRKNQRIIESADVLFLYLFPELLSQIESMVFNNLKKDAKIVSLAFQFKDHKSTRIEASPTIFIYQR